MGAKPELNLPQSPFQRFNQAGGGKLRILHLSGQWEVSWMSSGFGEIWGEEGNSNTIWGTAEEREQHKLGV